VARLILHWARLSPPATGYQPPVTSHWLPATFSSHWSLATSHWPPTTGHQQQATSHLPPATSHQPPATLSHLLRFPGGCGPLTRHRAPPPPSQSAGGRRVAAGRPQATSSFGVRVPAFAPFLAAAAAAPIPDKLIKMRRRSAAAGGEEAPRGDRREARGCSRPFPQIKPGSAAPVCKKVAAARSNCCGLLLARHGLQAAA
jgi:hypothetical protein